MPSSLLASAAAALAVSATGAVDLAGVRQSAMARLRAQLTGQAPPATFDFEETSPMAATMGEGDVNLSGLRQFAIKSLRNEILGDPVVKARTAAIEADLERATVELNAVRAQLAAEIAAHEETQALLQTGDERSEKLQDLLTAAREETATIKAQCSTLKGQCSTLASELEIAQEDLSKLRKQFSEAEAGEGQRNERIELLEKELAATNEAKSELATQMSKADKAAHDLKKQLKSAMKELDAVKAKA